MVGLVGGGGEGMGGTSSIYRTMLVAWNGDGEDGAENTSCSAPVSTNTLPADQLITV